MKRSEQWYRVHRIEPSVTLWVIEVIPTGAWVIRAGGWELPARMPVLHRSLEAAQRAADDALINDHPHDCQQQGCDDWL